MMQVETTTERREHVARLKKVLALCLSSRQRRAMREAIRRAIAGDGAARQ